ncbi:MAG TPA: hemolysin family protein [Spirochaetota bacterium]|nr:hemolysin family protein [Spirochaetota bacterium]
MTDIGNYNNYTMLIAVCILFSMFFSALETALVSSRRLSLETMSSGGKKSAARSLKILDNMEKALSMVLISNNIANICSTAFITFIVTRALKFNDTELLAVTLTQTVFFLVFCEITPKMISKAKAESFLMFFSMPVLGLIWLMTPLINLSLFLSEQITGRMNFSNTAKDTVRTRDDIDTFFQIGQKEGVIDEERQEYVKEILSFKNSIAYEVMTPAIDIVSLKSDTSIKDAVTLISNTKFSRIPIFEDNEDEFIGYIHYRDIIVARPKTIMDILIEPLFIPETKNIFEIYNDMHKNQSPLLFVTDEYGDITGLLTFEDIAEEIVGDIQTDDHPAEKFITRVTDRKFILSGRMDIDYFQRYFSIPVQKHHFETLSGFIISLAGKIPDEGERIKYNSCDFIIEEKRGRIVDKIQLLLPPKTK